MGVTVGEGEGSMIVGSLSWGSPSSQIGGIEFSVTGEGESQEGGK